MMVSDERVDVVQAEVTKDSEWGETVSTDNAVNIDGDVESYVFEEQGSEVYETTETGPTSASNAPVEKRDTNSTPHHDGENTIDAENEND
jgi:hypothetical protein